MNTILDKLPPWERRDTEVPKPQKYLGRLGYCLIKHFEFLYPNDTPTPSFRSNTFGKFSDKKIEASSKNARDLDFFFSFE